jgi:enoyl-CoA hydratase/carnithine racemase
LSDELEQLRCPTICMLNGGVYGGAIDLALACDFRIGVNGCQLLMPAARIGLHYYPSGIRRYVSRLGMAASKRLLLCAEPIRGEALLDIGFLDEIHPPAEIETRVSELSQRLQSNAPLAVEGMKQAINLYANAQVDDASVQASFEQALSSVDFKAGVQSISSKIPPVFKRG